MTTYVSIPIKLLLQFFDEVPIGSQRHATAVTAVAGEELGIGLLLDYFRGCGFSADGLNMICTPGTRSGKRLDKWVKVGRGQRTTYYQVEVKNWSAHAIGGRRLLIDVSDTELKAHKIERWSREWGQEGFLKDAVRKVLEPMRPPVEKAQIEPLVCFWDAMHPTGAVEALFRVRAPLGKFPYVSIFSMSSYLRELYKGGRARIRIEAPETIARLNWLVKLFGKGAGL